MVFYWIAILFLSCVIIIQKNCYNSRKKILAVRKQSHQVKTRIFFLNIFFPYGFFFHLEQLCIFSIFTHEKTWNPYLAPIDSNYSFQRDGTFQDKRTEVPSLSRDKRTTGQAQNLATGQDGPGQPIKIWDRMQDGTEQSLFFPYDFLL